jgi:hypothetical protein
MSSHTSTIIIGNLVQEFGLPPESRLVEAHRVVEVDELVRDFELLRVHILARELMLVQVRIQLLSHLAVISLFFFLAWVCGFQEPICSQE